MEDIVANALAVDSDDTANAEKVLARDSNAVKSTVFPEWKKIGALLANEGGGPSPMCYAIQGLGVPLGVLTLHMFSGGGHALGYIVGGLLGLAFVAMTFLNVASARVALMPGGKLDQLGAGEVMISEGDAASNARWRKAQLAISTFWVLNGLWYIAMGVFELPPFLHTGAPARRRIMFVLSGLLCCTGSPVMHSGWWASMHTASCLCRDAAVEVVKDVRATDPKDEEQWEAKVCQPALALREKFELLSNGWSGGLLGLTLLCWLMALAFFTLALPVGPSLAFQKEVDAANDLAPGTTRVWCLAVTALVATMPFPLAVDIASTSSWCDRLMEELNEARIKHGKASHLSIQSLETSLKQLNNGQGLGFVLAGSVLDRRSLKAMFIKLVAGLSTVVGYLLVLADDVTIDTALGDMVCDLTAAEKATVRSMLAKRNESCAYFYNMTVASVLAD